MKQELRLELHRQLLHALLGSFFIAVLLLFGEWNVFYAATALLVLSGIASSSLSDGNKIPVVSKLVSIAERFGEKKRSGVALSLYCAGVMIVSGLSDLFPDKPVLLAALIVLAYGDSVATLAGKAIGKTKILGNRTLEGTVTGIVVSFVLLVLALNPLMWWKALPIAIVGMLAEYLPIDDNISVPLVSALVAALVL